MTAWTDSIGGLALSQSGNAARPTYQPTGFNGAACLSLDGADDCMDAPAATFPAGSTEGELWMVLSQDSPASETGTRGAISYSGPNTTTSRGMRRVSTSGANRLSAIGADGSTSTVLTYPTVDFSSRHMVRSTHGPNGNTVRADGQAPAANAIVPATATDRIRIGALSGPSPTNFWLGRIRDVLVTKGLTPDQATHLQNFLMPRRAL